MSESIRAQFSCPDCGSESFVFRAKPHTMNNIKACAGCGRVITQDDILEHSRKTAQNHLNDIVRKAFKR
ncbi:ECs_2282 family putative zinc-binding protein [Winslowiella toletana]